MNLPRPYTLQEIASLINASYIGDPDFIITGTNEIHRVRQGDLVFVDHPKYYEKALKSAATTILIDKEVPCPAGKSLIISENPFLDFNKINQYFQQFSPAVQAVAENAKIGKGTHIQPNVFIGENVEIGENCLIHAGVIINQGTIIGNNVTIHSGTVIGSDAFYYKKRNAYYEKLISVGYVIVEDSVEIGANCTIDRGVTDITRIGEGTKIDNLVQIGHDTQIGKNCLFASQVGIAGCSIIEDNVVLWGQVGVISGVHIGAGAVVYGQSGIAQSIKGKKTYFGSPAMEFRDQLRRQFALSKLLETPKKED